MSISKNLRLLAMTAALTSPVLQAQTEQSSEKESVPITQTDTTSWSWTDGFSSPELRKTYDSLPSEYKAFAHKSFMKRAEMREEWEQRDYIKRLQKYNKDISAGKVSRSLGPAEGDYEMKLLKDYFDNKLTPSQYVMAKDLIKLGRPLSTVDTHKPFADQLRSCGFDLMASVIDGKREDSLSARDRSLFIWQIQEADSLMNIGNNNEEWRNYRIRAQKEDDEAFEKSNTFFSRLFRTKTRYLTEEEMAQNPTKWEKINGKDLIVPVPNQTSYSIRDEVTRSVAEKIESEQKSFSRQIQSNLQESR